MNIYQPYTYLIGWTKLGYWYYGCEFTQNGYGGKLPANPANLWTTYFTSSKHVANMREFHGEPDVIQVRRVFKTRDAALRCESKVLSKVNAVMSPKWLNRCNNGKYFNSTECGPKISQAKKGKSNGREGYRHTPETIAKIRKASAGRKPHPNTYVALSKALKGKKQTPEHREKNRLAQLGRTPWNKGKRTGPRLTCSA